MNRETQESTWWDLHLRKARGEKLSEADQQRYDAEMARQDQEESLPNQIESLKTMRARVFALSQENAQLRLRIDKLEQEIQTVERDLTPQTRHLLGVGE